MLIPADILAQHRYASAARRSPFRPGVVVGSTVLRGLRDLGFRDSSAAICALVDNAIDAGATVIDVVTHCDGRWPVALAVIDNGYGMVPEMLRAAAAVVVSCRLGDGPHLARNGFGLPAAPLAIGQRFDLFSCPRGEALHQVALDLDALDERELLPEARRAELPPFVAGYVARHARTWSNGTAVVISELDRVAPRSASALRANLAAQFGYVFGRFFGQVTLRLDGEPVVPIDPLFLTPGAVGHTLAGMLAIDTGGMTAMIDGAALNVRTARLRTGFCGINKNRDANGSDDSACAAIVNETNGFVVSRLGRRLAVLASSPIFTFTNADRPIRVELDFSPALDELLGPSLSLDQVRIAGDVWQALRAAGLQSHLAALRQQIRRERNSRRCQDAAVPTFA